DVSNTLLVATTELDDGRNALTSNDSNDSAFGHHRCHCSGEEPALIFTEQDADEIWQGIGEKLVNADEVNVGIRFGGGIGRITDQEANGDNRIETFVKAGLNIACVISLILRFDEVIIQII